MDSEKGPISVGPWGGRNGKSFNDGVYSTIRQLLIVHGAGIDSIQIEYDKKGVSVWSEKHGGSGGNKTEKVALNCPDEFLTSIHGHYGSLSEWSPVFVRSLTFITNKRTYGPFGIEYGTYFSLPVNGGKIVGFHGRSGSYLDAIGAYLKPVQNPNPSKALAYSLNNSISSTEKAGYSIVQGNMGKNFDIVLAVRQNGDYHSILPGFQGPEIRQPPKTITRQSSSASSSSSSSDSDAEPAKGKVVKVISKVDGPVTYGPWGGNGGTAFEDGMHTGIKQINLSRNVGIVSIKALYDDDGVAKWGYKHGGTGGFRHDKVIFDYPYEILTYISGTYGPAILMGPTVIKSLTFHTTKMKHGPFGEVQGTPFKTDMREGKIVGFHGRRGLFVDAIGVHVIEGKVPPPPRPLPPPSSLPNEIQASIREVDNPDWSNKLVLAKQGAKPEVAFGLVKEPAPCGPGPWGGDGGRPWDDGVYSGIKQIYLMRSEAIHSIQIEYDRSGQSVWSVKHGGDGGDTMHRIKLEYPHEVLTCISGYYGPLTKYESPKLIRSLTFHTSRGRYGPFGDEVGTFFTSTTTEGKVVGFHGRSGSYLDAIGVHMQHWLGSQRAIKPRSLYKMFN